MRRRIPTERRLMLDLLLVRQGYDRKDITNIAPIDGNQNPADELTKLKCNGELPALMETSILEYSIRQYGIDPTTNHPDPVSLTGRKTRCVITFEYLYDTCISFAHARDVPLSDVRPLLSASASELPHNSYPTVDQ